MRPITIPTLLWLALYAGSVTSAQTDPIAPLQFGQVGDPAFPYVYGSVEGHVTQLPGGLLDPTNPLPASAPASAPGPLTRVGVVCQSTLDDLAPGDRITPDLEVRAHPVTGAFRIEFLAPCVNEDYYLFTCSAGHFNEIRGGPSNANNIGGVLGFPLKSELLAASPFSSSQDYVGIDFALKSNLVVLSGSDDMMQPTPPLSDNGLTATMRLARDIDVFADPPSDTVGPIVVLRGGIELSSYTNGNGFLRSHDLVRHGYNVVVQNHRGFPDPLPGNDPPASLYVGENTAQGDGYQLLDQLHELQLESLPVGESSGIGLIGASNEALAVYLLLSAGHPAVRCAYLQIAPSDTYRSVHADDRRAFKSDGSGFDYTQNEGIPRYRFVYGLPECSTSGFEPYISQDALQDDDHEDWLSIVSESGDIHIDVPVLHMGGWYGPFADELIHTFNLMANKDDQFLVMGPWDHYLDNNSPGGSPADPNDPRAKGTLSPYEDTPPHEFFDEFLADPSPTPSTRPRVRYYVESTVAGSSYPIAHTWQTADQWPPTATSPMTLLLESNSKLECVTESPTNGIPDSVQVTSCGTLPSGDPCITAAQPTNGRSLTYYPNDPTPSWQGPWINPLGRAEPGSWSGKPYELILPDCFQENESGVVELVPPCDDPSLHDFGKGWSFPQVYNPRYIDCDSGSSSAFSAPVDLLLAKSDYWEFLSDPVSSGLEVTGEVIVRLFVTSTLEDNTSPNKMDWVVRLIDNDPNFGNQIWPDGIKVGLREFSVRYLTHPATTMNGAYPVELRFNMSHYFEPGHRIGLLISNSSHPRLEAYDPSGNGTGEPVVNTIWFGEWTNAGETYSSSIQLPVMISDCSAAFDRPL